jgi:hypothetical protein
MNRSKREAAGRGAALPEGAQQGAARAGSGPKEPAAYLEEPETEPPPPGFPPPDDGNLFV